MGSDNEQAKGKMDKLDKSATTVFKFVYSEAVFRALNKHCKEQVDTTTVNHSSTVVNQSSTLVKQNSTFMSRDQGCAGFHVDICGLYDIFKEISEGKTLHQRPSGETVIDTKSSKDNFNSPT